MTQRNCHSQLEFQPEKFRKIGCQSRAEPLSTPAKLREGFGASHRLLPERNSVSQNSFPAWNGITTSTGTRGKSLREVAINSSRKITIKKALGGLTSVQKYIQRMLSHVSLLWHAPSAQASRWSIFLALPFFLGRTA